MKLLLKRTTIAAIVLLVIGLAAAVYVGGYLLDPKPAIVGSLPDDLLGNSFQLKTDVGHVIAGWHVPVPQSQGIVLLLHGYRSSRLAMLQRARFLSAAGYSIVMIDLPAHGESSGQRITMGHLEKLSVQVSVDYCRKMHPDEKVFVIGVSLGGASALLASPLKIDGLIVESAFSSIERAVKNRVQKHLSVFSSLPSWLLLLQMKPRLGVSIDALRPIDHIASCGCPVFVISGGDDPYTTAAETGEMYSAAQQPKNLWLIDGATHTDLHSFVPEEYERRVVEFLAKHSDD